MALISALKRVPVMNIYHLLQKKKEHPKMLPPLAFLSFELTSKSLSAKIIRITQILIDNEGKQHLSEHYFNNGKAVIDEDAKAYHGISEEMLKDKPTLSSSTFNFKCARNIVVWDGKVTKALLKNNGIIGYSRVINMHLLARHLVGELKPIRLSDFALTNLPHKKNQLEILLRKPENKVKVLVNVFDHLSQVCLDRYGVKKPSFLAVIGNSKNKKEALLSIKAYLDIWALDDRKNNDYLKHPNSEKDTQPSSSGNKKKVI